MKRILLAAALVLATMFTVSAAATAAAPATHARLFTAHLTATQEVQTPPVVSNATGRATFLIFDHDTKIRFTIFSRGLGRITGSHIHIGARGSNGPVSVFLFPSNAGTNGEGWSVSGTLTAADLIPTPTSKPPVATFADLLNAIRTGNTYCNIHTTIHPAGEIRGQLTPDA
jgi:hypothetical protein